MTPDTRPYRRLLASLFGTLKLMQMYGPKHDATVDALANLAEAAREAAAGAEEAVVAVRGSRVQVNGTRMRASECGTLALSFLVDECRRRAIRALVFRAAVTEQELSIFSLRFLELDLSRDEPAQRLLAVIAAEGVSGIHIEPRQGRDDDPALLEERRETAMRSYLRGLRAFKDVLRCEGAKNRTQLRGARRAVQGLVDRFLEDETAVLALAQIRGHDPKLFHHSLNVCIYALAVGQQIGMSRRQLGELGLAALFHDVGKTVAGEGNPLLEHPARGARALLEEGTSHEGMLKSAIAAYEHHVHVDGNGHPAIEHATHLVSRIVAVADCYDSLTAISNRDEVPCSSADALRFLMSKAGTRFDPAIVKVLVQTLGTYPVSSLVELCGGETAIVVEGAAAATPDRPRIRILKTGGGALPAGAIVDLAEREDQAVARALPPRDVFESVTDFVAAL